MENLWLKIEKKTDFAFGIEANSFFRLKKEKNSGKADLSYEKLII
jgi:hypothetical protein